MTHLAFRLLIRSLVALAMGLGLGASAGLANAQSLVFDVPYAAGGPSDALVRRLATHMAAPLGGAVLVENQLGANGMTGLRKFVQRPADQAALILLGSPTFLAAAINEPSLLDQLRPVALVALSPLVIARRPGGGAFDDTVAKPARTAGALTIGISGQGTISHLCAAQLAEALGVPLKAVAYKGAAPMVSDLLGGQLDQACIDLPMVLSHQLRSGKLVAAAAAGDEAIGQLPGVPTLEALKLGGVTRGQWYVAMARDNASAPLVNRAGNALRTALSAELGNAQFRDMGYVLVPPEAATVEAATTFIQREYARMKPFLPLFKQ